MKIIKVLAYAFALTFCGWCIVTGSQKEEAAYEAQLEQQEHDLQKMRVSRISAGDTRYIESK